VDMIEGRENYIKHATRFCDWLSVTSKKVIDSLAIMQVEPIFTLEGFVKSMGRAFEKALNEGMTVVKINLAYQRSLSIENVTHEAARKVFRTLVNGNEDHVISFKDAKPLQDYMVRQLLSLAQKYHVPVAFHTGLQAGESNYINNSNPLLLTNVFKEYNGVRFVLFHGGYPFGGELSALAKNYPNVYIDMNWTYAISPSYAGRYLSEWLETVPVSKIMAFGGDQRVVELTYGNLIVAKEIITNVLIQKIREGQLNETEARNVATKILYENAMKFYNIR
jgi:predicted TIM-barrel fold metal-dependent hydrolase